MPRVSSFPTAIAMQSPGEPGSAQLRQAPVQALSQQTPSTHWFDLHSPAVVHIWPFCFGPHRLVVVLHAIPMAQSASL
jgi:hypothetical protein